jgi:hypothetical protein
MLRRALSVSICTFVPVKQVTEYLLLNVRAALISKTRFPSTHSFTSSPDCLDMLPATLLVVSAATKEYIPVRDTETLPVHRTLYPLSAATE